MKTQIKALACLLSLSSVIACNQVQSDTEQLPTRTEVSECKVDTTTYSEAYSQKLAEYSQPYIDAVNKYGSEKYRQAANRESLLRSEFFNNPTNRTKQAIVDFHKETKVFAMLMQPASDQQIAEAKANNEDVLAPYIIEWDADKIDLYYANLMTRMAERKIRENS